MQVPGGWIVNFDGIGMESSSYSNRRCHQPVEDWYSNEFIENARRASVINCNDDRSAKSCPRISRDNSNRANRKQGEIAFQFLDMASLINFHKSWFLLFVCHCAFFWIRCRNRSLVSKSCHCKILGKKVSKIRQNNHCFFWLGCRDEGNCPLYPRRREVTNRLEEAEKDNVWSKTSWRQANDFKHSRWPKGWCRIACSDKGPWHASWCRQSQLRPDQGSMLRSNWVTLPRHRESDQYSF